MQILDLKMNVEDLTRLNVEQADESFNDVAMEVFSNRAHEKVAIAVWPRTGSRPLAFFKLTPDGWRETSLLFMDDVPAYSLKELFSGVFFERWNAEDALVRCALYLPGEPDAYLVMGNPLAADVPAPVV